MKRKRRFEFPQAERLKERLSLESPPPGVYGLLNDNPEGLKYLKLKFSELPISKPTQRGLSESEFFTMTPIQMAAIPHALASRDILGTALTGSGKSLAFMIPVLENLYREKWTNLDGLGALVLTPNRELGIQLFEVLRSIGKYHGFSAGLIIGGKNVKHEQERVGRMNILIATPGRLLQHLREVSDVNTDTLKMLVIDEADRILDMGFEETLNSLLEYFPKHKQTLLFSATLSKSIKGLAKLSLRSPEYINVLPKKEEIAIQKKLIQYYMEIPLASKLNLLFSFIRTHVKSKILVFFSACKQVRFVYEAFKKMRPGVPLMEIHGKQKQNKRTQIYYKFIDQQNAVLFATDVAARGLDFPNIHWVVQVDCPEDIESYVHRVGRTARYKASGNSLLFLTPSELPFVNKLEDSGITIVKKNANSNKMMNVSGSLSNIVAENNEIKHLAQKYFISYVKSIFLMPDKSVFNVENIPVDELAESLGLPDRPHIEIAPKQKKSKLEKFKEKIKNKKKRTEEKAELPDINNTEEGQDEFLVVKRTNHDLHIQAEVDRFVSKKKLKKITPDGYFGGANKTYFDDFGNPGTEDRTQKYVDKVKEDVEDSVASHKANVKIQKLKKKKKTKSDEFN